MNDSDNETETEKETEMEFDGTSAYLNAEALEDIAEKAGVDIQRDGVTLTFQGAEKREARDPQTGEMETSPHIFFAETDKMYIPNKTAERFFKGYLRDKGLPNDSKELEGHKFEAYLTETPMGMGIRFRPARDAQTKKADALFD